MNRSSLLSVLALFSVACVAEVEVPMTGSDGGGMGGNSDAAGGDGPIAAQPGDTISQKPVLPDPRECSEHSDCDDLDYCSDSGLCEPEGTLNCKVEGEIVDCTVDHGFEIPSPPGDMRCCSGGESHHCGGVIDCNVVGE